MREDVITYSSAMAEFMGALLLQLFAGSTTNALRIAAVFTALMACFARHSGGHINPAITLAAALSGHLAWFTAGIYMLAQFLGALAGAAIQVMLTPGLSWGMRFAASCHEPAVGLGGTPLYFWETLGAFVFVYLLYPAILAKPGYGPLGPLFAGVALFAVISTAGPYTGYSPLNPALTFAGSLVFNCVWRWMWMYLLAQLTGAGLAALLAVGVFGMGPMYMSAEDRTAYEHYTSLSAGPDREGTAVQPPAGAGATLSNF
jgi:glycerol uptake facilitator-like aquaporin